MNLLETTLRKIIWIYMKLFYWKLYELLQAALRKIIWIYFKLGWFFCFFFKSFPIFQKLATEHCVKPFYCVKASLLFIGQICTRSFWLAMYTLTLTSLWTSLALLLPTSKIWFTVYLRWSASCMEFWCCVVWDFL